MSPVSDAARAGPGGTLVEIRPERSLSDDDPSDAELLQRCLERRPECDEEAFRVLYDRHLPALLGFLRRLLPGDEHAARDRAQETFFRLFRALDRLDTTRPLRPWLYTVGRNLAIDHLKRGASAMTPAGALGDEVSDPTAGEERRRGELSELVRRAVATLDLEHRAVYHLKHVAGLTFDEVASVVGCSPRTAKTRMKRALEAIGAELERLGLEV